MTMTKPIGIPISAFDATNPQTFYFTSSGGDQVVQNELIIRLNSTNERVSGTLINSYNFNQTLNANKLENGTYYNFSFVTYSAKGEASEESDPISFYCYTTPKIEFTNVQENKIIENASYKFKAKYSQKEGELIDFLKFYIYDANNNIVSESDNLYSSEELPITFSYTYEGFENDTIYKIQAKAISINGTKTESDIITFKVGYTDSVLFNSLSVENKCNEGYNQITSNIISIDGKSNQKYVKYIDNNTKLDLTNYNDYVVWDKGYKINSGFILELWINAGNIGKIFRIGTSKNDNTLFQCKWVREIPFDDTSVKDYVEIVGNVNKAKRFYMKSNYIDLVNNTSDVVIWFKYDPLNEDYELILSKSNQKLNQLNWNTSSNVEYNQLTNLQYLGESYKQSEEEKVNVYGDMTSIFPIDKITIYNGIYDNLDVSINTEKDFSIDKPEWDYYTVVNCNFNENINGGNIDMIASRISSIKIKCREVGKYDWITLKEIKINSSKDLNLSYQDYRVPKGANVEYAIVPIMNGGIEGNYITQVLKDIKWNKLFISDISTSLSLFSGVSYGNFVKNISIGSLEPINSQYPIVLQNGEVNYISGSISGKIIDESSRNKLDRVSIVNLIEKWNNFLSNGKSKIIKDWNGNIWICKVNVNPNLSYSQEMSQGYGIISFSFVEQGKWNNQDDLKRNILI